MSAATALAAGVNSPASYTLSVPATRGKMGSTVYFTATFPMGMLPKMFSYDPEKMASLPVEQRTQRALKRNRIPEISEYILNDDQYFFSSLTVSINADWLDFVPSELDENVGMLKLPMEAEWIVNDGQHRVAGIVEALAQDSTLKEDRISVVVLPDEGLERSQQIFSDLNRNVQKTSRSLDILFDRRNPTNRITNKVVTDVKLFKGRTDKERLSLSVRSGSFATIAGVQSATVALLGHVSEEDIANDYAKYEALAIEFWEHVTTLVEPWADIASGALKPGEARQTYISSYQMTLAAIGAAGSAAMVKVADTKLGDWKRVLRPLKSLDWKKSNPDWQGLTMIGNEVVTRITTRKALADYMRWKIGVGDRPTPTLLGQV